MSHLFRTRISRYNYLFLRAPQSFLVAPPSRRQHITSLLKMKYMVALDGSDNGNRAYQMAERLMKENDILYLTTVIRTPDTVGTTQGMRDGAIRLILGYEELCKEARLNFESIVVQGTTDAREAIINMVDKYGIDVLIVGTRGLSAVKKVVLGSVSSYCVQNCPCDVLVVK